MIPTHIKQRYKAWGDMPLAEAPIKEKILIAYHQHIKTKLDELDGVDGKDYYERLETLLKENWDFIKGTMLSYNSIPNSEATEVLCQLAEELAHYRNGTLEQDEQPKTAIEYLMSGLHCDSIHHLKYPHLSVFEATEWTQKDEDKLKKLQGLLPGISDAGMELTRYQAHYEKHPDIEKFDKLKGLQSTLKRHEMPAEMKRKKAEELQKTQQALTKESADFFEKGILLGEYKGLKERHQLFVHEQGAYRRLWEGKPWLITKTPLIKLLEESILSANQADLIPVQVLLESDPSIRPYSKSKTPQDLELEQRQLMEHSPETRAFADACLRLKASEENESSLWGNLNILCYHLRFNDAHGGVGSQESAGKGAYPAIIAFRDYYGDLADEDKDKIPEALKNEIETLLDVAFNKDTNRNAVTTMETCIGTRRQLLEQQMDVHKTILKTIANTEEHKVKEHNEAEKRVAQTKLALESALKHHTYKGDKPLPLSKKVLENLKIQFTIKNIDELHDALRLSPAEFIDLTNEDSTKREIVALFDPRIDPDGPNKLVTLFLTHGRSQMDAFLTATHPHLCANYFLVDYLVKLPDEQFTLVAPWVVKDRPQEVLKLVDELHTEDFLRLLKALPESERLESFKRKDCDHNTLLHKVANKPVLLKELLSLVPEKERLALVNAKNKFGHTVLCDVMNKHFFRPNHPAQSFRAVLSLLPEEERLKAMMEKNLQGQRIILHQTASHPIALHTILNLLPKDDAKTLGVELLSLTTPPDDSLKIVLGLYTKDELQYLMMKTRDSDLRTLLHRAHVSPESLKTILSLLLETYRLDIMNLKDKQGRTVFDYVIETRTNLSLQVLLSFVPEKDRFAILRRKDQFDVPCAEQLIAFGISIKDSFVQDYLLIYQLLNFKTRMIGHFSTIIPTDLRKSWNKATSFDDVKQGVILFLSSKSHDSSPLARSLLDKLLSGDNKSVQALQKKWGIPPCLNEAVTSGHSF